MDLLLDQYKSYRAQYDSATRYYSYAHTYGLPVISKVASFAQESLFKHPDLTSVALLLVILYISFVFLVKAWRLTIGTVVMLFKASLLLLLATCTFGVYHGIINGDMSILHSLMTTSQFLLRSLGDLIIGGNTSKEPARKLTR